MKKNFTVVSSTKTQNGTFCNKIVNKSVVSINTDFGMVEQNRQETYYMFTKSQNQVGAIGQLDPNDFKIVKKLYTIPNDDGTTEEITLKYLYPK